MGAAQSRPMEAVKRIELVYFNICARGELTRLAFAYAGMSDRLIDTKIPLFLESDANRKEWLQTHKPRSPFSVVPYLKVTYEDPELGEITREIGGDGVLDAFVGRCTGLMGKTEMDAAVISTICNESVGLQGPELTEAGLHGRADVICGLIKPEGSYGMHLTNLEVYVKKVIAQKKTKSWHCIGDSITMADLSIYNCMDECFLGPRGNCPMESCEQICRQNYPTLMTIFDKVHEEMKDYIEKRQEKGFVPTYVEESGNASASAAKASMKAVNEGAANASMKDGGNGDDPNASFRSSNTSGKKKKNKK